MCVWQGETAEIDDDMVLEVIVFIKVPFHENHGITGVFVLRAAIANEHKLGGLKQ